MTQPADAPNPNDALFEFPCDFPLKVMGRHAPEFREVLVSIVEKHAGSVDPARIEERVSRDGNYISLTCTFTAHSRQQLDALYLELTASEYVKVAL